MRTSQETAAQTLFLLSVSQNLYFILFVFEFFLFDFSLCENRILNFLAFMTFVTRACRVSIRFSERSSFYLRDFNLSENYSARGFTVLLVYACLVTIVFVFFENRNKIPICQPDAMLWCCDVCLCCVAVCLRSGALHVGLPFLLLLYDASFSSGLFVHDLYMILYLGQNLCFLRITEFM